MKLIKPIIIGSILAIVCIGCFYITDLIKFPGKINSNDYQKQIKTEGVKSTFHEGVIYRHPNTVPLLEVKGDYYEMGLQYGVLLRREIERGLDSMTRILQWNAKEMGLPYKALIGVVKFKARGLASRLPERFQEELRGVADGSGVPFDTVIMCSLLYDINMEMNCGGVLMRGDNGTIIQGRNNDTGTFGGDELAKMTVVVRHHAPGKNAVTHMDLPILYMGVETGFNDKGLSFGEETLRIVKSNPKGFSLPYLIRMILEDASTLEEVYPFLDKYSTIGAYGTVWSDLKNGTGAVIELTPTGWAKNELKDSLLWNFNRFYDSKLAEQQTPAYNITSFNSDRDAISEIFPKKDSYTVEDAIEFMRGQIGPDGSNYAWSGTKLPVCNLEASQMMIFDSNNDGFYMAVGPYYAARQDVYHYFNDFSRQPELFMPAVPIEPIIEKAAQIENKLISKEEKLKAFINLADEYPDDANVQFIVAHKAFQLSKIDIFSKYADKAFLLQPDNDEYQMYAGMLAYHQNDMKKAIALLDGVTSRYPEQDLIKLTVLEKAYKTINPSKSLQYKNLKQQVMYKYNVEEYYKSDILPYIKALDN